MNPTTNRHIGKKCMQSHREKYNPTANKYIGKSNLREKLNWDSSLSYRQRLEATEASNSL